MLAIFPVGNDEAAACGRALAAARTAQESLAEGKSAARTSGSADAGTGQVIEYLPFAACM